MSFPPGSGAWLAALCSSRVLSATWFVAYSAVLPLTQVAWGLSGKEAGMIQAAFHLAVLLLEPASPDSFFQWGFFDEALQPTEYVEAYVMEPMAEAMLAEDAALKAEYEAALAADPRLAADPKARLQWLYARTPFFDERWAVYPVMREP